MGEHVEGYQGPLTRPAIQGRAVEPDLPAQHADAFLRDAAQAIRESCCRRRTRLVANSASLQRWAARGFRSLKAYALCTDDAVIGAAFYIMSMEEGRVFWDPALPSQTREARRAIFTSKIETLARLHGYNPQAIGLGDFGKPGNYFARQVDRWTKQYRASETQHIAEVEKLIEAAGRRAASGACLDRPRRLSPRQHDLPPDRAAGGSRYWTGNSPPSAIRWRTSPIS